MSYNVLMEIRPSGHSAYCPEYQLVWVLKYHWVYPKSWLTGVLKKTFSEDNDELHQFYVARKKELKKRIEGKQESA